MSLKIQVLRRGTDLVLCQGLGVIISLAGEILSFVKIATGRISIATLARLQENRVCKTLFTLGCITRETPDQC